MIPKCGAKFEKKLIFCFENDKNLVNFDHKSYNTRVIFHDTVESCKIWRKTDLWFGKWHEEIGKFSSVHLKLSKLLFSWDPFAQSRKCMGYKLTEELQVIKIKNDKKFEEELVCHSKTDIRNLTNFDLRNKKSQKFTL